ncbi:hypothetical protein ACU8M5_10790 [Rhizobium leguminosarum]
MFLALLVAGDTTSAVTSDVFTWYVDERPDALDRVLGRIADPALLDQYC